MGSTADPVSVLDEVPLPAKCETPTREFAEPQDLDTVMKGRQSAMGLKHLESEAVDQDKFHELNLDSDRGGNEDDDAEEFEDPRRKSALKRVPEAADDTF